MTHIVTPLYTYIATYSLAIVCKHAMIVLHWSWLTPTHCLLFIGHSVQTCNDRSPSAMPYTHALLVFPIVSLLILYTVWCIWHPLGSLQVKAICYTWVYIIWIIFKQINLSHRWGLLYNGLYHVTSGIAEV